MTTLDAYLVLAATVVLVGLTAAAVELVIWWTDGDQ